MLLAVGLSACAGSLARPTGPVADAAVLADDVAAIREQQVATRKDIAGLRTQLRRLANARRASRGSRSETPARAPGDVASGRVSDALAEQSRVLERLLAQQQRQTDLIRSLQTRVEQRGGNTEGRAAGAGADRESVSRLATEVRALADAGRRQAAAFKELADGQRRFANDSREAMAKLEAAQKRQTQEIAGLQSTMSQQGNTQRSLLTRLQSLFKSRQPSSSSGDSTSSGGSTGSSKSPPARTTDARAARLSQCVAACPSDSRDLSCRRNCQCQFACTAESSQESCKAFCRPGAPN